MQFERNNHLCFFLIMIIQSDSDNRSKTVDNSTGFNGKLDEGVGEPNNSRKQSPHTSPSHINTDLTNGTGNEAHSSVSALRPGDDPNDNVMASSHMIINSLQSPSVPIPYQRIPTTNMQQQDQQQQQQMLLFQQQAFVFFN